MFLIGLTGGIASGKSTVASHWRKRGASVIDADEVARDVVSLGSEGLRRLVEAFGDGILDPSGALDRGVLGRRVFTDPRDRRLVDSIVHPLVQSEVQRRISDMPRSAVVVYDVPLLVEAGVSLPFDAIVTVSASERVRVERLRSIRGMSEAEAWSRVGAQASEAERLAVADYVVDSSGTMSDTLRSADLVWGSMGLDDGSEGASTSSRGDAEDD